MVQRTQGSKEGYVEGALQGVQGALARKANSTEVDGGKASRARRGENHRGRVRKKGEGEWGRGIHPCRVGEQGGKTGKGNSRQQQPCGCWLLVTATPHAKSLSEQRTRHLDNLLHGSARHQAGGY